MFGILTMIAAGSLYPLYARSMLVGKMVTIDGKNVLKKSTPPRSTWFLWLVIDIVAFGGELGRGKLDPLLFTYILGTAYIAYLTIQHGEKKWTVIETICTGTVAAAILLGFLVGPLWATVCALTAMLVSLLPLLGGVLRGGYEDRVAWRMGLLSSALNLLDGQILVSICVASLQSVVLLAISYHWGFLKRWRFKPTNLAKRRSQ